MHPNQVTEDDRFPLLDERGRRMLDFLSQHPHAPRFNYHCGEKLTAAGLERVKRFAERLQKTREPSAEEPFSWLDDHVRHCWCEVPYFRERDQVLCDSLLGEDHVTAPIPLGSLPFTDRHDFRRQPWSFVPDGMELGDLIVYSTSGTTGNLIHLICDPSVPASYLPLFEVALAEYGLRIEGGERVSILQIAAQRSTYTLMSPMSYFDSAGFAKINLNPNDWGRVEDRQVFIDACHAEIYTGDPFAFIELSKLELKTRPKAILSSATTLLPAIRKQLEAHFRCPVIDVYSMNETGPIAYHWQDHHRIFPHRIFVEIIDRERGVPLPDGELGEIVVTGGINPWMPLLRYRTGDVGAMGTRDGRRVLTQFTGREPVDFYRNDGTLVRSIDITVALYHIPLPFFRMRQQADGSLRFETCCQPSLAEQAMSKLRELFGPATLSLEQLPIDIAWQGKSVQFISEFAPPC